MKTKISLGLLVLVAAVSLDAAAQAYPPPDTAARALEVAEKAAAAAQRAADAAQTAAEAAARSAAAAEKATAALTAATPAAAPATTAVTPGSAAIAAAKPPEPPKPAVWTGIVGVGLIALTGNSQAVTFKGTAAFERKTPEWIYGIKASGAYGQAHVTDASGVESDQVNALAAAIQARGDRRFNPTLSVFLLAGEETDHLKSIEHRPYGEIGVSLQWWDERQGDFQKSAFRTDLGFRYGHEYRFGYYAPTLGPIEGVDIVAPHLGALFRYGINKDVIFTQDADLLGNLVGEARLLLTTNTKLAARLTEAVSLGITFSVAYDSVPAAGRKTTDTALSVGIEVGL